MQTFVIYFISLFVEKKRDINHPIIFKLPTSLIYEWIFSVVFYRKLIDMSFFCRRFIHFEKVFYLFLKNQLKLKNELLTKNIDPKPDTLISKRLFKYSPEMLFHLIKSSFWAFEAFFKHKAPTLIFITHLSTETAQRL